MAATDDFFGTSLIGLIPGQDTGTVGMKNPTQAYSGVQMDAPSAYSAGLSPEASATMEQGTGGNYNPQSFWSDLLNPPTNSDAPGPGEFFSYDPNNPPTGAPPAGQHWWWNGSEWIAILDGSNPDPLPPYDPGLPQPTTPTPAPPPPTGGWPSPTPRPPSSGGTVANGTTFEVPPDLLDLRNRLGGYFLGNIDRLPSAFPGQPTTERNFMMDNAFNAAQFWQQPWNMAMQAGDIARGLFPMFGDIPGGVEQYARDAANQATWARTGAEQWLNRGGGALDSMAATGGGAPIWEALAGIRGRGMQDIQDQQAALREQFAASGMGVGSDINEALMRATSRGVADIESQQSQFAQQILGDVANRQLGAISQYPSFANAAASAAGQAQGGSLGAGNLMLQALMGRAQGSSNLALGLPGTYQTAAGISGNAADQFTKMGAIEQNREQTNMQNIWQEFIRQTTPQNLQLATQYATAFPGTTPVVQGGGGSPWATLGSAAISILPFLFSSRELKEDIEPVKGEILPKLKKLPIYKWQYKGDKTRHVGPMAEEFRDMFGVGDGITLHPLDMFGVLLGSMKEMAHA